MAEGTGRSFAALRAKVDQVDNGLFALRGDLADRVVTARDDGDLVEIGVSSTGEVVEVAVNAALVGHVAPAALADAVLRAARRAQQEARRLVADRTTYHLGASTTSGDTA
ncbi:YbaB/EbfC family nucleoid-associated protein [Streptoalloteichus hindustanus]|uniref:Conserved DNA-binding protein YbaB n=1 Tax=Streptoalloteichus hindustanus TaxID=2017 RepID=A0A1M4U4M8_STRHI|nr:YbaB/EbfC family nucleoid-associated protein [Streptoalloteichus hindustanus]SHE51560.1 Conserved DNA-binding protein YbaB [Streptoalloteichus hindustanus]